MSTTKQFTITRAFDAPRAALWRAWTDPAIAAQWWHPHEVVTPPESVEIDLRVGGTYRYLMVAPDGSEYPTGGEYLEVREPERLRFSWADPDDAVADAMLITIDLRELPEDRCEMTFHLAGVDEERATEESIHTGWSEAFAELDAALARA
ncbi:SRPBCC family protein [Agrococcus sp. Marseille-P2731]|uniref:SRPBCC family protein n=1 Tax=Agrococcus sp. Marseille-P2731 TaxID=1841862 RepID=UPI0009309AEB|nr:SRPBCC domain-containing protein [Agrococcus sp. Marseille-P2731]